MEISLCPGANETIEHLLKTIELILVDLPTRFEPISEDCRTGATHQGRCLSLPRRLHLAARAAEDVAQDLPKDVSSRSLGLARSVGTSLCGYVDLKGTYNDWFQASFPSRLLQFPHDLAEYVARHALSARGRRIGILLTTRDLVARTRAEFATDVTILRWRA